MKRAGKTHINQHGFTMIEIVVALMVLFIVSAVVVSRSFTTGTNELMVEADGLKASLRYAQIQSLNNDTATWGIHFTGDGTSYILYKNGSPAVDISLNPIMIPVKIPDAVKDPPPANTHRLQGNVQITSGVGTTATFDKWGRPVDGSGNPVADISLSLNQGTQTSTITITKNTGYIP